MQFFSTHLFSPLIIMVKCFAFLLLPFVCFVPFFLNYLLRMSCRISDRPTIQTLISLITLIFLTSLIIIMILITLITLVILMTLMTTGIDEDFKQVLEVLNLAMYIFFLGEMVCMCLVCALIVCVFLVCVLSVCV